MHGRFLLWFLLVLPVGCTTEKHTEGEFWKVKTTSMETFYLKTGFVMHLNGDSVTFSGEGNSNTFYCLMTTDRLMMKTGASRMLFSIERLSGSGMIVQELYTRNPLKISFIKITNH
jgi:hypothetical protein